MGRASTDLSSLDASASRRRRGIRIRPRHRRRRRSPTPTSPELTSPPTEASVSTPSSLSTDIGTGTCVAVVPLPLFRGDPGECPDAHLARFDRVCLASDVFSSSGDVMRMFAASLDGDAAWWYDYTISASSPPPWHAVRAAFADIFRPPGAAHRARGELASLRQRAGESVNRYHLRMQGVLQRCDDAGADVADEFVRAAFVGGLRDESQRWVARQQPKTLDYALALALSWERAESMREARVAAQAPVDGGGSCGFCGAEGHEEARCEVRRRMMELWVRNSSSMKRSAAQAGKQDGQEAEEGGGSAASNRSSLCECPKHQCWKRAVAAVAREVAGGREGNGAAK